MNSFQNLVVRDDSQSQTSLTPTMTNLLIALVVLFAFVTTLVGTLLILRSIRRTRKLRDQETLPMYTEKPSARSSRITINASSYAVSEKQALMAESSDSEIPEIRITFPEEIDESGKRTSGRVVVVKVGEHSVGLEPVHDQLPAYQKSEGDRFQSLDLERMGGLKEKESDDKRWS